jgi:type I restriction enzyme, S subunit
VNNGVERIYGDVPFAWRMTRLGELVAEGKAELQTGPFGTMLHASAYSRTGTPVIAVQHIGENKLNHEDLPRVDDQTAVRLERYRVRENDIIFGRKGAVERRALIRKPEENWLQGSDCIRLRFGNSVDAKFISYVFGSWAYREWIVRHAHGATMPSLNQEILRLIPLPLPSIPEQRAIASILGVLDDKIELNRRMNETLEALAQSLFKSWFVDTTQNGLPEGWRSAKWGELATLEYGKSLSNYDGNHGIFPVYGTNGRIGSHSTSLCNHAGIIIGRKGAYRGVHFCDSPFFVIDTAFYVEPKTQIELRWAYYEFLRLDINGMDSGSAIPSTSRADFYNLPVSLPPFELQRRFVEALGPCWAKQEQNKLESRTLAALRDALLPKLLSGELRVSAAAKLLEAEV